MPRVCDDWLVSFLEWTLPRSEAPASYVIWSGLSTLASVARRHVSFPKSLMGSYSIWPNLYVIFVGPAGGPRKTTTVDYCETLLVQMDEINLAASAVSASKLIEMLSETPDGAMSIISGEFAQFINVTPDEMYDTLMNLYDGKIKIDYATRQHGIEVVENPCINMIAATTPEWIANYMPPSVIGGGFASRVVFVFESKVRHRQLYYDKLVNQQQINDLEQSLLHDLVEIAGIEGEFRHDSEETKDSIETWYKDTADLPSASEKLDAYYNRKPAHLHKVAGLLSLAERSDLVVTMSHFEKAKEILEVTEKKMARVFTAVGKNPYSSHIERVLDFIEAESRPVFKHELLKKFYYDLVPEALASVLESLIIMGEIVKVQSPDGKMGNVSYRIS